MPSGVRGLRSMFHATAVEVLLYLTPVHCQDMLDSLTTSLNATFTSFMKRNPAFQVCPPSPTHHAAPRERMLSCCLLWQACRHGQLSLPDTTLSYSACLYVCVWGGRGG